MPALAWLSDVTDLLSLGMGTLDLHFETLSSLRSYLENGINIEELEMKQAVTKDNPTQL